ncbi:unnamed protein product [Ixodes hexagonus]
MPFHCCVPLCKQMGLKDASGNKVSLFAFPSGPAVRKKSVTAIKRDEGKYFTITKYAKICSGHFQHSDYLPNVAGNRRYLKQQAVPSVFAFNALKRPPRKKPRERQASPAARKLSVGDAVERDAIADLTGDHATASGTVTGTSTNAMEDFAGNTIADVGIGVDDGSTDDRTDDCADATVDTAVERASDKSSCQAAAHGLSNAMHMHRIQDLQELTDSQAKLIQDFELELQRYKEQLRGTEDALSKAHTELRHALSKCSRFDAQEKELQETKQALFRSKRELELTSARCSTLEKRASRKFSIGCFKDSPADVQFYTGLLSYEHFMSLWHFLVPGEDGENVKVWSTTYSGKTTNAGRHPILSSKEQVFLLLIRLRLGLFERDLAYRFRVSIATVSKVCTTWINDMYVHLAQLPLWLPRLAVDDAMPPASKDRYASTRVILDATEVKCEASSSLVLQSASFSSYKSTNTFKGLIGISPDGTVTFVSQLFTGSISDKGAVEKSGFLKLHFDDGDSVMADKGFKIEELLKEINVKLNIPPFLHGGEFTSEEVKETEEIASLRIHVERRIQRIKNFHIFNRPIRISIAPVASEIWTVCAILSNFQSPLIKSCDD